MTTNEAAARHRQQLVEHGNAIKAALNSTTPEIAAYLRANYRLDLYPMEFIYQQIRELEAK